jgi:hypothetical protein
MKKYYFTLTLFAFCFTFISFNAVAQDTIFYKKAGHIVVIVKEVSTKEVQYKKLEMPDGPMYIIDKNDIEKIVYKNGYVDVIKPTVAETPANQPFTVTYSSPSELTKETVSYRMAKRRYSSLVSLIDRHPDVNRRPELMKIASSIRGLKGGENATRTVAIVFGAITLPAFAIFSTFSNTSEGLVVPATTAGIALLCTAAAVTFHVNLTKKRKAFVDVYNQ